MPNDTLFFPCREITCHSSIHQPIQTHTHAKSGPLKSTYSLLGNRVGVSVWPLPTLYCSVPCNKSHILYVHTLKLSSWREYWLRNLTLLHFTDINFMSVNHATIKFMCFFFSFRMMADGSSHPHPPPRLSFSWDCRISLQPSDEVATATAGPCAAADVLWPPCRLWGSQGQPSPWQHGHLTLAPNLPSAFPGTKTFRRHRCCCTRLLKIFLKNGLLTLTIGR